MKRFVWLFLIVVVVAALWSAGWFFAAGQVQDQLAALKTSDGVERPQLVCSKSDVTGFPFRLDVTCEQATLVSDDITITAAGIKASVQVDNPTHLLFSAKAPVTMADAFYGTSTRLDFTNLQGSFRVTPRDIIQGLSGDGWRIARISLVGDGLDWVDTIGTEIPLAKSSHAELQVIDLPDLHDKTAQRAALAIYAVAKDVVAPNYQLGNANGEVQLQLDNLPDDLRAFNEPTFLDDWRAAGGKVEVLRINGTDGNDLIDAAGTLALDANRMLEGDITYTNRGIRERLAPYMDPIVLSVIAGLPQPDGTLKQALQFSGGSLRIGGIPLVPLAPLY